MSVASHHSLQKTEDNVSQATKPDQWKTFTVFNPTFVKTTREDNSDMENVNEVTSPPEDGGNKDNATIQEKTNGDHIKRRKNKGNEQLDTEQPKFIHNLRTSFSRRLPESRQLSSESKEAGEERSTPTNSLGSTTSLDLNRTPLGSRGSLCDEDADDFDSVNVVVRCRPLNEKEKKSGDEEILTFPGEGQIWVNMDGINGRDEQKPKAYTFNVVFEPEATQEDILDHSGVAKLIDMAIDGFSSTVFCYGQTGSGKTHTLTGPPQLFEESNYLFSEGHGLIFRSFVYLFNQLHNRDDREFTIHASFLEIYNEKVIDLLNVGTNVKPLQVRWNKKRRSFFVENLFSIECAELDDLLAVLEEGLRNRAVASHNMNEYSSRSHTILAVCITSEQKAGDGVYITKNGKINFVDLAGSEMTKKTNSEGKTLEEANNINKSLMVLGTCIAALSDPRKKDGHIPYRDSKLTKLLADSLAGAGVTLMIACVSPSRSNMSETLNTLRYAARAKRIKTKPIVIMDPKEKHIMSLQREVAVLQEENQNLRSLLYLSTSNTSEDVSAALMNGFKEDNSTTSRMRPDTLALAGTAGNPNFEDVRKGLLSRQPSFTLEEEKLKKLNDQELLSLLKRYMSEYDIVKKDNRELKMVSSALIQDQERMAKENERLLKKLEEGDRSQAPSHVKKGQLKAYFKEEPSPPPSQSTGRKVVSQVWINPRNDTNTKDGAYGKPNEQLPASLNKELEKRRIGRSLNDLANSNSSLGSSGSSRGSTGNGRGTASEGGFFRRGGSSERTGPTKAKDQVPIKKAKGKSPQDRFLQLFHKE